MRYSYIGALLAGGVELAAAGRVGGSPAIRRAASNSIQKRQLPADLSQTCADTLMNIGFDSAHFGINAQASGSQPAWIGTDGPYTNNFVNNYSSEICLVVWGSGDTASFPTSTQPLITISLASGGGSQTLSFDNLSGAFAAVYPDTTLTQYGQIGNTWGEFTYTPSGVNDVSREVFAQGHTLEIDGPGGVTNMDTCVFVCNDSTATTCGDAGTYHLQNCDNGAQPGNNESPDDTNGGVGWLGATTAQFTSTFS